MIQNICGFPIYVDDTTLSIAIEIVVRSTTNLIISEILNNELLMVNNQLKVNKTLKIDNVNIERVAELNFLGLTIDGHGLEMPYK